MVSELHFMQHVLRLQLLPPRKSQKTLHYLAISAQGKRDKLIKLKQWGRSRYEKGRYEKDRPVELLDQQLLHKTDMDQSTLISCRLWALNSATSHSSHRWLRCKVNSIDNYCSAWISRPLLCNLEAAAAEEAQCVQKRFLDTGLTNPYFKPDNYLFY